MRLLAETCERIGVTTKKLEKTAIVADYLKSRSVEEAAVSAVFLSGRPFPAWEETTLQIGGRSLWAIVAELAGKEEGALTQSYRRSGDLGAVAADVLPERPGQGLGVLEVEAAFRQIAGVRGAAAKIALVRDLFSRATPLEAKYIIKITTGELRIGLKESLVEEAIAKAYGNTLAEVQRANMLLGDIGETVRLAAAGRLSEARMRLFHPLGFMLASPVESTEEGLSYFPEAAVEDKYDGIRAQAHVANGEVRIFSRTRDEITESFPELPSVLAGLPLDVILDGEIVAWEYPADRALEKAIVDEAAQSPLLATPAKSGAPDESEQKADNLFLTLLRRFTKEGRNVSDKSGTSYAPAQFTKQKEAKAAKATNKMLADAMERLFETGQIKVLTEGPPSHPRTRLAKASAVASTASTDQKHGHNENKFGGGNQEATCAETTGISTPSTDHSTDLPPPSTGVCVPPPYNPPPGGTGKGAVEAPTRSTGQGKKKGNAARPVRPQSDGMPPYTGPVVDVPSLGPDDLDAHGSPRAMPLTAKHARELHERSMEWIAARAAANLDVTTTVLEAELRTILCAEVAPDMLEAAVGQVMDLVFAI